MPYTKVSWVDEKTPLCADNLNHMEDGIENAQTMAEDVEKRATALEEVTLPNVVEQINTLRNDAPLLTSELDPIMITTTGIPPSDWDESVPIFNHQSAAFLMMRSNVAAGYDEQAPDRRRFIIDVLGGKIYYLNALECLSIEDANPLLCFKASNEYDAESESAMSGIAVEAALDELRDSIPDLVLEKFPNLDEVSY